jgi:hypothetical protein
MNYRLNMNEEVFVNNNDQFNRYTMWLKSTKKEHMKRSVQKLALGIIILLSAFVSYAQITPVQVTPQLVAPYSLQVSEYYSGTLPKIQVLLINRDINQPTIQVKLKMTIESQNCRLRTKDVNTTPTITLTNGVPYYLAPNELQAYFSSANLDFGGGMSEQQYNQTLRLPEGLYTFTFEAYELYSNNLVSNKGFSMGWLTLADPPLLNMPAKGEEVAPTSNQAIFFNWTPRHNTSPAAAYYTDYIFTLVEYNDPAMSPEAAFVSSNPILTRTISPTSLSFSSSEPITTNLIPGKRYAWRVQAKAKNNTNSQEIAMFRNNGFSEVNWFTYQNNCAAPQGVTVNVQGQRATIEWQNNPQHLEWKVEYREHRDANQPQAEWFTLTNTLPRVVIMDLKPSTQYEYRVGGACYVNQFTYTAMNYFSTASGPVPPVANCGDSTYPALGTAGLQTLNPGDTIRAGSFIVNVGYSTGAGNFTGTGYVKVPWLMNAKVEVRFTNITVSNDYKLVSGLIETTYDPTESGIDDIDEYVDIFKAGFGVGDVVTGEVTADKTVDFIIQWPNGIQVQRPADYDEITGKGSSPISITLTPQAGGAGTTYTVDQLPTTIKDKDGNLYQVDKAGNISQIGKAGGSELLKTLNTKVIDKDKAEVKFVDYPTKQVYAFDAWNEVYKKSSTFSKEYERIGDYYVSQKAIAPGQTDYLKAVVTVTDTSVNPRNIEFVNGKGTIYSKKPLDSTYKVYEIVIVGGPEKDAQEIYAVYKPSSTKTLNLGKVKVSSYPKQEFKIKLVPVNGATINADIVREKLNAIYNPLNISIVVSTDDPWSNNTWDENSDGKLDVEGSGLLSSYTPEMKFLRNAYINSKSIDASTFYLFVLQQASTSTVLGDMPRGKQFGFLFTNNNTIAGQVVGHETGHGVFQLKHTFDGYGFAQNDLPFNVMDYSGGEKFVKLQWDYLHDPAIAINLFGRDEDNQINIQANEALSKELLTDTKYFCFVTPNGQRIVLDSSIKKPFFAHGLTIIERTRSITGCLLGFQDSNGNEYHAQYDDTKFDGYKNIVTGEWLSGGALMKSVNELIEKNDFILYLPDNKELGRVIKFRGLGVSNYTGGTSTEYFDESNFIKLYEIAIEVKSQSRKTYLERSSVVGASYDKITPLEYSFIRNYELKSSLIVALKIAQLANLYKEYFIEFTFSKRWSSRWKDLTPVKTPFEHGSVEYACLGVWDSRVKNESVLSQYVQSDDYYSLLKEMLNSFKAFIVQKRAAGNTSYKEMTIPELQALDFDTRISILRNAFSTCVTNASDWSECENISPVGTEESLVKVFLTTPDQQEKKMLDALLAQVGETGQSLLYRITRNGFSFCGLDGADYESFASWLDGVIKRNQSFYNNKEKLLELIENKKAFIFKPGFWKSYVWEGNDYQKYIDDDGTILLMLGNVHDYSLGEMHVTHPYQMVLVKFESDFVDGSGEVKYKKGDQRLVPAYSLLAMINAENNHRLGKTVKLVFDVALIAVGVGELRAAMALASSLNKTVRVSKAIIDLTLGLGDIVIQEALADKLEKSQAGKNFLDAWNNFQIFYGIASLSSELTIAAKRMRTELDNLPRGNGDGQFSEYEISQMDNNVVKVAERAAKVEGDKLLTAKNRLKAVGMSDAQLTILDNWGGEFVSKLDNALRQYSGLALELKNNPELLSYFKLANEKEWALFGIAAITKRQAITHVVKSTEFSRYINDLPVPVNGINRRLSSLQYVDETNSGDLGNLFDNWMERNVSHAWANNDFSNLPPAVANRLTLLKNDYELVTQATVSINGKNPRPDMIFIKKEQGPNGVITLKKDECIYIDNKILWDTDFSAAQKEITNNVSASSGASVISQFRNEFSTTRIVAIGDNLVITKVETFSVSQSIDIINSVKKP